MIDHALALVKLGYRVCPLPFGAKAPPLRGFAAVDSQTVARSEDDVARLWSRYGGQDTNIAIVCGRGLVVIDVDSEAAMEAVRRLVSLDNVPVVQTPRGRHLYYSDGGKLTKNGRDCPVPGVDRRGAGGYVCAPGSIVGGLEYSWLGAPVRISELPVVPACLLARVDV